MNTWMYCLVGGHIQHTKCISRMQNGKEKELPIRYTAHAVDLLALHDKITPYGNSSFWLVLNLEKLIWLKLVGETSDLMLHLNYRLQLMFISPFYYPFKIPSPLNSNCPKVGGLPDRLPGSSSLSCLNHWSYGLRMRQLHMPFFLSKLAKGLSRAKLVDYLEANISSPTIWNSKPTFSQWE